MLSSLNNKTFNSNCLKNNEHLLHMLNTYIIIIIHKNKNIYLTQQEVDELLKTDDSMAGDIT